MDVENEAKLSSFKTYRAPSKKSKRINILAENIFPFPPLQG